MKKVFALILSLSLIFCCVPFGAFNITASAEQAITSGTTGDCTWTLDGTVLTISGNGEMSDGDLRWLDSSIENITEAIIEEGVTSIGNYAFRFCEVLERVTIPSTVIYIGHNAFYGCYALKSVNIPKGVVNIGRGVFENCIALENITIASSVEIIEERLLNNTAFYNNSNNWVDNALYVDNHLIAVKGSYNGIINEGTLTIAGSAFEFCYGVSSVNIPDSVVSIGAFAFNNSSVISVYIPSSVKYIGSSAFSNCNLKSVTIPEGVETIGSYAFSSCSSLSEIIIPDSVKSIGSYAFSATEFYDDKSNWEDGVLYIGSYLIDANYSSSLEYEQPNYNVPEVITVKDGTLNIAASAFGQCASLKCVNIPNSLIDVNEYAFSGCESLTDINYIGTEQDKANIDIDVSNTKLLNATWHYVCENYGLHDFENVCDVDCSVCGYVRSPEHFYSDIFATTCSVCGEARAAYNIPVKYEIVDGEAVITDCDENFAGEIVLPQQIDGYPLTTIRSNAFAWCSRLTNVVLPESITEIGSRAFYETEYYNNENNWENGALYLGNYLIAVKEDYAGEFVVKEGTTLIADSAFGYSNKITGITIPSSVKYIGRGFASGCYNLAEVTVDNDSEYFKSVDGVLFNYDLTEILLYPPCNTSAEFVIPSTVKEIPDVFRGNSFLKKITIPEGVTEIIYHTFSGCTSLEEISLPESLISIESGAFSNCTSLKEINIPKNVSSIQPGSFERCTSLTNIFVHSDNASYSNLEGVLYNKAKTELVFYPIGRTDTTYDIPNTVTVICGNAFNSSPYITNITIPDSVEKIGASAFGFCEALKYIEVGNNVKRIEGFAFENCEALEEVKLGNNVKEIGLCAFTSCYSLKEIVLPDSVTTVGNSVFNYCASLEDVVIGNGLTAISYNMFSYCTALEKVKLGTGLVNIEGYAFENCTSLKSVVIPEGVVSIQNRAFCDCTSLADITLPDSLLNLSSSAFDNTAFVNDENNWENGVLYCGKHLLVANNVSGDYYVKDGTVTIHNYAFNYCEGLTSVIMPDSVKNIGCDAFYYCASLSTIELGNNLKTIGDSAFGGCDALTAIKMPDTVTEIGMWSFMGCDSLKDVELSNSVTGIAYGTFRSCVSIESIVIPKSVESLDPTAFGGCSSLVDITVDSDNQVYHSNGNCVINTAEKRLTLGCSASVIPNDDSVKIIGKSAFDDCYALKKIDIPNNITHIEHSAFSYCTSLTDVSFSKNLLSIDARAFALCFELNNVVLPDSVRYIGRQAFIDTAFYYNESNWENGALYSGKHLIKVDSSVTGEFTVKEGTLTIAGDAFADCYNITSVVLPESVVSICDYAFNSCGISVVYYGGTKLDRDSVEIGKNNSVLLNAQWHYITETYNGDIDGNGVVNVADIANLKKYIVGLLNDEEIDADVNRDGIVNVSDLATLKKMVVGLI